MPDDPRLSARLRRWRLAREQGNPVTPEELCADCPELLPELLQRIAEMEPDNERAAAFPPSTPTAGESPAGARHSHPRTVGRYHLEELLGEGTFGQVWRAFDPVLQRAVALKLPRPDRLALPRQREAFIEEARRIARLEHPGIVPVFDVGQDGAVCFIVSRLITGGDLARRIAQDRPGPREAARIVADVAECLHHAHRQGFIHRDIKPANILLDRQGRPLLCDFGQAVGEEEQTREDAGIVGTLPYMAPEQARGDSHWVDGRADIYSLGGVLYELLTGRRPFSGRDRASLREQVLCREPRPPRALDDSVPRELERICLKCLAKVPSARYATARDLAEELHDWLAQEEPAPAWGGGTSWLAVLTPLNFDAELSRLRRDFVGRGWLDAELEHWLEHETGRVFLLTGDPGAGKSAYLAHVVGKYPQVTAYHFCVASLAESFDPVRFVQSIAAQIAERHAGYRQVLARSRRDPTLESDAGVLLRRLVADPLRVRPPAPSPPRLSPASRERGEELLPSPHRGRGVGGEGAPVLIVVDALDEAVSWGGGHIARVLGERLNDLPPQVRLVISSRQDPEILDHFSHVCWKEIEADRPENRDDVAEFVDVRLQEPEVAQLLQRAGAEPAAVARLIARKAAGNFLYAAQAVQAIRSGQIDPARPDTFPEGLIGVYQAFFERLFPRREGYEAVRPLLDVLLAAREPLTVDQLAFFLESDRFRVETDLQEMASLFPERDGRYGAYHKSVSDWLCGQAGRSRAYRVNLAAGHRRIAARLLPELRAGRRDAYALAHLPTHLLASGQWEDVEALLTDLRFIEARCAAGLAFTLVNDYRAALAAWPGHRPYHPFGPTSQRPPGWVQACTAAVAAGAPDPHPGLGSGPALARLFGLPGDEPEHMPAPESAALLARMRQAEAASQTDQDPHRADTSAGRVQAFATLVSSHVHFLHQHPHETIPLARNESASGFVAERAGPLAETLRQPWVARDPRPPAPPTRPVRLGTLRGHTDVVLQVALSGDGRTAASAGQDLTVRLWDVASGECRRVLSEHDSAVTAVALTPDGRLAVSGADNGTLRCWEVTAGACYRAARLDDANFQGAAVTPDGRLAAFASRDGRLVLWDIGTGSRPEPLPADAGALLGVSITPDGKLAVTAGWDGTLQVWDVARRRRVGVLGSHALPATGVAVSADGGTVVSAGYDQTLRVWDVASGRCLRLWNAHASWVQGAALTADGAIAVSAGWDGSLRVWDVRGGDCVRSLCGSPVCGLALTPDGTLAATACYDQTVRVWDLQHGTGLPARPAHHDIVFTYAWSADGARAVSASRDQTLRVWDVASGQCLRVLRGHTGMVHGVALTPDGKNAVSSSWDGTVRSWDVESGTCLQTLLGHRGEVRDVALTADGRRAVSAGYDHTVRVWDLQAGRCLRTLEHADGALSVAVSPDGRLAVSGGWDGTLCVWDLASGRRVETLAGHRGWITAVALTLDGQLAISASQDTTLRVWELASGRCLHVLAGHTDEVMDVTVTADGGLALSASDDNTVRVWDIAGGRCLAVYHAGAEVRSVSEPRPDGRFCCGTVNGQIHRLALRNCL